MTILAIDAGTTAFKIMRVDSDLRVRSTNRIPVQDLGIHAWSAPIRENLKTRNDGEQIDKISVTDQMHGLIPLEDRGYGEGIPWTDQRGASMLSFLDDALGPNAASCIGGPLASGFQVVSLAWIRTHDPEHWRRIPGVMLPKDALVHALTGRHVTDPSDAASTGMLDVATSTWAWDLVDAVGIPREWLPEIVPSGTEIGPVTPKVAAWLGLKPDVPVIVVGGDAPAGAFSGGATEPGQALSMLSTGAQIILPADTYSPDPAGRWYTWPSAVPGNGQGAPFLRARTLLNAGIATSWFRSTLQEPDEIALDPTDLITLSHLIGERTPLRDPLARGAILGITPQTSPGELSRAVLEGIAYAVRHALDEMRSESPMPELIRLVGGGAQSDAWQWIIANVLGIPTGRIATADLSAFGAAAIATGKTAFAGVSHRVTPDPGLVDRYQERYEIYLEALQAVTPISHRLASVGHHQP